MLQSIQKHIQGWLAGVIIAVVALTFALWGIQNYLGGNSSDKQAVAHVAGDAITRGDFMHYYRQVLQSQPSYASLPKAAKTILKQQVLAELVQKKAILTALQKSGFAASDAQVRSLIMHESMFQRDGEFSLTRFQQLLSANGLTEQAYAARLKQQLMMQQLQAGIERSAIVTTTELASNYALLNQTRDFGYFIVPAHLFLSQLKPSSAQIADYYNAHKANWLQPEQLSVEYLQLSPKQEMANMTVSASQVKAYYEQNKSQYKQGFSASKDKIKAMMQRQLAEDKVSSLSDELANVTYTNPESLAPAAKALGLKVQSTTLFSKDKGQGIAANKAVRQAAFGEEVLSGNNSNLVSLPNGDVLVLRLKQKVPAHVLALKAVQKEVVSQLKSTMASKKASELAAKLEKALAAGQKPLSLAKQHRLIWKAEKQVVHSDKSVPEAILNAAFLLPYYADDVAKNSQVMALGNGDYAVLQVQGFKLGQASKMTAKERTSLGESLQTYAGQLDYRLLTQDILQQAKVKIDQAALQNIG